MTHRYPEALVVDLANLLRNHHATELFPTVLGLVGDQIQPEPRTTATQAVLGTDTIRHLVRLFDRAGHLPLLADVVELLEPWLPTVVLAPPVVITTVTPMAPDGTPIATAISSREIQVLAGMANGLSNAEIGRTLWLSEDTVKSHARKLFKRLDVKDRAHAVRVGIERGLLPITVQQPGAPAA